MTCKALPGCLADDGINDWPNALERTELAITVELLGVRADGLDSCAPSLDSPSWVLCVNALAVTAHPLQEIDVGVAVVLRLLLMLVIVATIVVVVDTFA